MLGSVSEMSDVYRNKFWVEFEAAVLSEVDAAPSSGTCSIGWLVRLRDPDDVRTRYRCFHFTHLLGASFENTFFTSTEEAKAALPSLDALVIVDRLDALLLGLVESATSRGTAVFLDLCDDLLAADHIENVSGLNKFYFNAIAPVLAGVTVPSAVMAERLEAYFSEQRGSTPSIHVVPDIAETWENYSAAFQAVSGNEPDPLPDLPEGDALTAAKQVVWFGGNGKTNSKAEVFGLKRYLKALKSVHDDIPLELVVIGDSEPVYRGLVENCGFPTRYVAWSAPALYSELARADVALLPSSEDGLGSIKSNNRVLLALAAGVPVVTEKSGAIAEFEEALFLGRAADSLRNCIGPSKARKLPKRMRAAQRALARYTPNRVGRIWAGLLSNAIGRSRSAPAAQGNGKALFFLEAGDDVKAIRGLLSAANKKRRLDYDLLIPIELVEGRPEFEPILRKSRTIPKFYSGPFAVGKNMLVGYSAVVAERPSAPIAKQIASIADELDIPFLTSREAISGSLDGLAVARSASPVIKNTNVAGPYPERLNDDGSADWAFIVDRKARGWILDAICREIGSRQPESWQVVYHPAPIPKAKNFFFSHYALFEKYQAEVDADAGILNGSKTFVWYTHPREESPISVAKHLLAFEKATKIIFACESNRQTWLERGLPEDKTAVILGGADANLFQYHDRGGGVVGLSSSFYERKNPDCLLEVMKLLPHRQFLLLGRKWNQYALFEEMRSLPNFSYKSVPYRQYPDLYSTFDVFLSMSNLEGGPIPLVEAMMSNAVPVASRTGFAPDLIRHGENGFIFDLDASPAVIAEMIEAAYLLPTNVRETVVRYDWDNFSSSIVKLAQ